MDETNRTLEVEYTDPSLRDGTYDVSFELTEDAEDALFAAFTNELRSHMRDGTFPAQKIHLFHKLATQRTEHPPWIDATDGAWTYDLELSEWEYHLITRVVGQSLDNILAPGAADKYEQLIEAWQKITQDMQIEKELDELEDELQQEQLTAFGGTDNGEFQCLIGTYQLYKDTDTGEQWYVCTDCGASFDEVGDTDVCTRCE